MRAIGASLAEKAQDAGATAREMHSESGEASAPAELAPKRAGHCKAVQARKQGSLEWTTFCSGAEAAHVLGLNASGVSQCCHGYKKHTSGYELRFAINEPEEEEETAVDNAGLKVPRRFNLNSDSSSEDDEA